MSKHPVAMVLFDGICNLCSASVVFIIRADSKRQFQFASLQSDLAQRLMQENGYQSGGLDSVVLIVDGRCYDKSRAVLEIARRLDPPWPALYAFILVPRMIADWLYDFVGTRRYRWFGKQTRCYVPKSEWKDRFPQLAGSSQADGEVKCQ